MAQLSYAFSELKLAAQHAAGKASLDSGNSLGQCVNSALNYLVRYHAWDWRTTYSTSLATVSGNATVDLPADFGELIHLWGQSSPYSTKRFRPVNHWEIPILRQQATAVAANARLATTIFYAINGKAQASSTAVGLYQLQLHPTPAASTSNAFYLVYRRLAPTLSGDTDVADIPTEYQDVLLQLCRAFACIREQIAGAESEPNWQKATQMLESLKATNDRVMNPVLPKLTSVVDDYFDVGKLGVTWT